MKLPSLLSCLTLLLSCIQNGHAESNPQKIYARDERTQLVITEGEEGNKVAELRTYGSYEAGEYSLNYGDLIKGKSGSWSAQIEQEGRPAANLNVTGKIGADKISVKTRNLAYGNNKDLGANGTYELITPGEQLEMARNCSKAADKALNEVYAKTKSEVGEDGFPALRKHQREWLEHREYMSEAQARGEEKETSLAYWQSFTDMTVERCNFLQYFSGKNATEGRTGVYTDGYGGHLELEETDAGLVFHMSVVRGPTYHVGEITEVAKIKAGSAVFKHKPEPEQEAAEITFTFPSGHQVQVDGKNTSYYHGARAYFDGLYFKKGDLEKPIERNPEQ